MIWVGSDIEDVKSRIEKVISDKERKKLFKQKSNEK